MCDSRRPVRSKKEIYVGGSWVFKILTDINGSNEWQENN
jgi:hypothetical protein